MLLSAKRVLLRGTADMAVVQTVTFEAAVEEALLIFEH